MAENSNGIWFWSSFRCTKTLYLFTLSRSLLMFKFINFYRHDFYRCKPRLHVIYELTKDCLVADYVHFANLYILNLMLPTIYWTLILLCWLIHDATSLYVVIEILLKFTWRSLANMSVADEAAGLMKGLAEVVKSQRHVQQTALQQTNDQLQTLSNTVASLTQKLPSSSAVSHSPSLHLLNLVLPIYTGRESILKASGIPTQYLLTYLKQQTQKDSRALDAICEAETSNIKLLGEDPSKPPLMSFYTCMKRVSPPSKQNAVNRGTNNCENFWVPTTQWDNKMRKSSPAQILFLSQMRLQSMSP